MTNEQKLREALQDADVVLQMADRSDAWKQERDRCRQRIADAISPQPTSDEPDKYCITQADGECVSTDPRCMHQSDEGTPRTEAARNIRAMDRGAGEVAFDMLAEDLERTLHARERELARREHKVDRVWKDKKWVCADCGGEPQARYIVTGHDHTDETYYVHDCLPGGVPSVSAAPLVEALLKYHERFDNFGMQGYGPDREVFYCEDCKQEHKDYAQIQHSPECRAVALINAIREYKQGNK